MGNKVLLLRFPCVVFKILFFLIPGSFHQTKKWHDTRIYYIRRCFSSKYSGYVLC